MNDPSEVQVQQTVPAQGPQGGKPHRVRASAPTKRHQDQLGPLRELGGTWVGQGFNLISLPDFDNPPPVGPQPFRLKLNATVENLQFTQIGGNVPNRGSTGQEDINLFGLTYLQRVSDASSSGALHIEPGLWLYVEPSDVPPQPFTVVRQGSIPHGTSILAQGSVIPTVHGGPIIQPVDSTPFTDAGPITNAGYLTPFTSAILPPGVPQSYVMNPNQALVDAIAGQTIICTEVLDISTVTDAATSQGGGILNIPFVTSNANVTQFNAIFWIETVLQQDGTTFMQLQYTQTVILDFLNIHWPYLGGNARQAMTRAARGAKRAHDEAGGMPVESDGLERLGRKASDEAGSAGGGRISGRMVGEGSAIPDGPTEGEGSHGPSAREASRFRSGRSGRSRR